MVKFLHERKKRSPIERLCRNLVIGFRIYVLREPSWIAKGDRKRRRLYYAKYKALYKQHKHKIDDELEIDVERVQNGLLTQFTRTFCEMKNTFKILTTICLLSLTYVSSSGQFYNPDRPMIVPFAIEVNSVNEFLKDDEHDTLAKEGGYVKLPTSFYTHNGKSHGIIVVHAWGDNYYAVDSRCPVCFYEYEDENGGTIDPMLPFSECNKCGASADALRSHGSTQMFRYHYTKTGPVHMDAYIVNEVKKGKRLYLFIDNAPNRTGGEWRNQPENKIIIERYRQLYGHDYSW